MSGRQLRRSPKGSERVELAPVEFDMVDDQAGLDDVVKALLGEARYAIDTEFHRERTYFPRLALVQIAWGDPQRVVLIDPLAISVRPLGQAFDGPGVAVIHAAAQDLEVLELACGTVPAQFFDTQVAAGFVGLGLPSLSELHEREMGTTLPKGDRLTDWLRRPLDADQMTYAASDVSDLLPIHDKLLAELTRRGRLSWVEDECLLARNRARTLREPDEAWSRLREVRQLRGRALAVAQEMAAWRERRAARLDLPTRYVLPDLAVASVAQRAPSTEAELAKLRGVEERFLKGGAAAEILEAVQLGLSRPPDETLPSPAKGDVPKELRAAISLLSAWVAQRARDLGIDPSLLATRADIEDLLRDDEGARLLVGWRAESIGSQIRDLLAGRSVLAFDGRGGLLLEARN